MQSWGNADGSISTEADNASDVGAVTIAADCNDGPEEGSVDASANAGEAIGV